MLYDEFVQGTGCRETDYNYRVYKDVEQIYMNSNMTKEEAYAIGKMRVDNSLTKDEQDEIFMLQTTIYQHTDRAKELENWTYYGMTYKEVVNHHKDVVVELQSISREVKELKERIKDIQSRAK